MTLLLDVQHLSVEYVTVGVSNHAVNDVSFAVAPGEVVGIVGESGCGKSTAILATLGLTRPGGRIVAGSVKLEGSELVGLPEERLRAIRGVQIGVITQNPRGSLDPVMRVGEQIAEVYRSHRESTKEEARRRALELLRVVGINDPERRLESYPHELSGGMAQRALIAIALSCTPKLLIADEPTSGLDVTVQAQVLDDLRRAVNRVGSSMVLVTQDLGIVANYCDRIYLMHAGEVVEEAGTEAFFAQPSHPASAALLIAQRGAVDDALRLRGFPVDGRRLPAGCYVHPRCPFAEEESGCFTEHPGLYTAGPSHTSRCHRHATVVAAVGERMGALASGNGEPVGAAARSDGAPAERNLEIRKLVKRFPIHGSDKVVHACEDVSLDLVRGETLGLIGESGSGKTTLGRCVLRLVEPTSGEIVFEGREVTRLQRGELRRLRADMQIVFQEPFDSLNPQITVGRQVGALLRIHTDLSKDARKRRVLELLELVGLPANVYDALPSMLSPGALQRASIARAIATEPKLIVLDEPTSALAPEAEAEVIALLKDIQGKLGLTYIFISHDLSLVRSICDRVAVMYLSQIVELGGRDEVFAHPRHPYSRALLASVLLPDPKQRRDLADRGERLEGEIPSPIDLPQGCYLASRCPYVRERCRVEPQDLQHVGPAHWARCWRMAEGDLTEEEIERVRAERASVRA